MEGAPNIDMFNDNDTIISEEFHAKGIKDEGRLKTSKREPFVNDEYTFVPPKTPKDADEEFHRIEYAEEPLTIIVADKKYNIGTT